MTNPFLPGATKTFRRLVTPADFAILNGRLLHELFSTFALGRDMEWTSRQFVDEMLAPGEAGIGTGLEIEHRGPAFAGDTIEFTATFETLRGSELSCTLRAQVGERLVATGRTRQRILPVGRLPRPPHFGPK